MKLDKIIVSEKAFKSKDPYDIIYSNITVVNLLRDEGIEDQNINEDALTSYNVDYYLAQYNNGNFSQFVWNSKWSVDLNDSIKRGLQLMGASKHLDFFNLQCGKVENLEKTELASFLQSPYFDENPTRDKLNNDAFFSLDEEESIIELNSNWLKNHSKLQVMTIENMFLEFDKFFGRKIAR
jgi:hypothetical protein